MQLFDLLCKRELIVKELIVKNNLMYIQNVYTKRICFQSK